MVFVFKDFNRVPLHVNSIPMTQLENVKEWLEYAPLDECVVSASLIFTYLVPWMLLLPKAQLT
jgi:nucleosome binding factor SPN SPT16 subunit